MKWKEIRGRGGQERERGEMRKEGVVPNPKQTSVCITDMGHRRL